MMDTYYIRLQVRRFFRIFSDHGLHPSLGTFISLAGITFFVFLLFNNTQRPFLALTFIGALGLLKMSSLTRGQKLEIVYSIKKIRKLRLLENLICSSIFILMNLIVGEYMLALILLFSALTLPYISVGGHIKFVIPTPFKRSNFEAIIGFRRTIIIIMIAYFVIAQSLIVENYGLCLFGSLILFVTQISFYSSPEKEYYVWINKKNSGRFLRRKVVNGLKSFFIVSTPAYIVLLLYFQNFYVVSTILFVSQLLYLVSIILLKYVAFPNEMGPQHASYLFIGITLPPSLFVLIPILYNRAKDNLNYLLK